MPNEPLHYVDDNGLLYYDSIVKERLAGKADESDIPTAVSELQNDSGYQTNAIETVKVNGSALTPSNKAVDVSVPTTVAQLSDASDYAKKTDLVGGVVYKGTVQSYSNLPVSGQAVGDMYNVATADSTHGISAGDNVIWNGSDWDVQRGTIDMSGYYNSSNFQPLSNQEIDDLLAEI